MERASIIPLVNGCAKILSRSQVEHCDAWKTIFQGKCKDHRFYEIMAQTLATDFQYQYLVLEDSAGKVRAIQPIFFLRQNVCEGVSGTVRRLVDKVQQRFPRFLTMRVLMVGMRRRRKPLGVCLPEDRNGRPRDCTRVSRLTRAQTALRSSS